MNNIKITKRKEQTYQKTKAYLLKTKEENIEEKLKIIETLLSIEDKEDYYSKLYDLICDYLDNEFQTKNICGFCKGICKRRQDMINRNIKKDTYRDGCCHRYITGEDCKHLIPGKGCKIRNIGCKLFTCHYLKKQGYRYSLNKIYLSRYLLNYKQKRYLENTLFVEKEIALKEIIKLDTKK